MLPFVGVPGPAVEMDYELKQAVLPAAGLKAAYPMSTMVYLFVPSTPHPLFNPH
jgi:ammonium transporter, Amt family